MSIEEKYIKRAIDLAQNGLGMVSPNPLVGCVIVHEGKIVGEGWHEKYGQAHAEVNAIRQVPDSILEKSVLYSNLEPCVHHGKTPPCTDLILEKKIPKVVVSMKDPNPQVLGKGIKKLKEAGVEVVVGMLHDLAVEQNKRFIYFVKQEKPYVVLKWAQTTDGYMARYNYDSKWISSDISRVLVHKWRSQEDSILVGRQTAHNDNPRLDVRMWNGRNPVRLVIDRHLNLSNHLNIFDGTIPTLCFNLVKSLKGKNVDYIRLESEETFLEELLKELYQRNIQSVMVEGGALILNEFIKSGNWNEARVFMSPTTFGSGINIPSLTGVCIEEKKLDCDTLSIIKNPFVN